MVTTTNTTQTIIVLPPNQLDGTANSTVAALGSWLNSGGQQQNMPSRPVTQNDNVLPLMFTTSSTGQPLVQASWAFFSTGFSGRDQPAGQHQSVALACSPLAGEVEDLFAAALSASPPLLLAALAQPGRVDG